MSLEIAKKAFWEKIKEYPELTPDRQSVILELLELAAKIDWKSPKKELPEKNKYVYCICGDDSRDIEKFAERYNQHFFYDKYNNIFFCRAWCELPV